MASAWTRFWSFEPGVTFLNHGSFGACPRAVQEHQHEWQRRLERDPVRFFAVDLERELDHARACIAAFVGAAEARLAFIPNATTGANAVLASFPFEPGDELLLTDHGYPACSNAARYWANRAGAEVKVARLPFPLQAPQALADAVLEAVSPRTRLVLLDHVTSASALVLPLHAILPALRERNVQVLIDGAHAPGMVPLELESLAADYYVGNLHKWCCAPKGAAFLWAREPDRVRPLVKSHGAESSRTDRSRFRLEFDWTGTCDPSAVLSAPFALEYLARLFADGWRAIESRNRELVLAARRHVADALGLVLPCPDDLIGAMATLVLAPDPRSSSVESSPFSEPLHSRLYDEHRLQVMAVSWPSPPARVVRLSAHLYNDMDDFQRLARALQAALR